MEPGWTYGKSMDISQIELYDNQEDIINDIIKFNNDSVVQRLRNIYYNQNLPEIFAVSRRELSHSSFLAWLFTSSANHGLGTMPLLHLLELYILSCNTSFQEKISYQLYTAILSRNIKFAECSIITEDSLEVDGTKGRADIVLDYDIIIPDSDIKHLKVVIENKVYSSEHDDQTTTYWKYYNNLRDESEEILYIYLTPPSVISGPTSKYFVHITYQELLDHVLEQLLNHPSISQRTQFILNEYINCLSIPSYVVDENSNKILQTSILAISMEEKELLRQFIKQHSRLIKNACNALLTDDDIEESDRTLVEDIVKMAKDNKDRSKYAINGKGEIRKCPLAREVIKTYLELNNNVDVSTLQLVFPDELQGGTYGVVRSHDSKIKKDRYYEIKHPVTKEIIYVCSQWTAGPRIDGFIKYVNENIDGIEITLRS